MPTKIEHAEHVDPIRAKTKERELQLSAAYNMDLKEAKVILTRDKDHPGQIPWEQVQQAKAFIAAYETEPTVVSKRKGWKRQPRVLPSGQQIN